MTRSDDKYLFVEIGPYAAGYDTPEDCYQEFVQEACVTLCRYRDEDEEEDDKRIKLASLDMLVIRGCRRNDNIDVYDMADAHSGEAEEVAGYLHGKDGGEFYAQFDVDPAYANALLIDDMRTHDKSHKPTTEEIRRFVRRAVDQFNVELVFIRQADDLLAQHFRGYFEADGPFLIHSQAHCWPEPPPEPVLTSAGGEA